VKKNVENRRKPLKPSSKAAWFNSLHWERCAVRASQKKSIVTKIGMRIFDFNFFFLQCIAWQSWKLYYQRPAITQNCSYRTSADDEAQPAWHFGQLMSHPHTIVLMKVRIDKLLVERGLVPSRERAQAMVLSGRVLVNEQKIEKAGASVDPDAAIRLLGDDLKYVGRGGLKLEAALRDWKIDLTGRTCMDVGASTGGFTDCMLQHCAAEVVAVDTGYGQIHVRLRSDPRVKLLEKTNARYLTPEDLAGAGATSPISFIAIDVSFISVTLVLPAVLDSTAARTATAQREAVILIKPQFEVGRELVGKGGIVKDEAAQHGAVRKVRQKVEELGGKNIELMESPILGMEGNREFLLHTEF
jgi:23S rRNA (cytidine1920-2'-O)/16S rRNA (cytidine1409-2'-O)-methyltransferase